MFVKASMIWCQHVGLTVVRLSGFTESDQLLPTQRMGIAPAPVCQDDVIEAAFSDCLA